MARYTLEYRAPKHTKWHALSVSALAPFTPAEVDAYRQTIAEQLTMARGVAIMPAMVRVRLLVDGKNFMEYGR